MQPDKPSVSSSSKLTKTRKRYALFGIAVGVAIAWGASLKFILPLLIPAVPRADAEMIVEIPPSAAPQISHLDYQAYELEKATVHVVTLPAGSRLNVAVADDLMTLKDFAQQENALVVLNGGFFDPQNGKTTSHLISQGQAVGDPADNERLVGNPKLAQYMTQILNRSEFRVYACQTDRALIEVNYDIVLHDAPVLDGCITQSAMGGGPQLLPEDTSFEEGFIDYQAGELVRDAIGSMGSNARSAIALTTDNNILLMMVAQRLDAPGLSLSEVADFAASLGAVKLLNLDGGSSSSIFYDGQTYFGKLDADGNPIERPIKSVIVVGR